MGGIGSTASQEDNLLLGLLKAGAKNHGRQVFVPGVEFPQPMAMTEGKSGIEDRSGISGGADAISQLPLHLFNGRRGRPPRESSSDLPLREGVGLWGRGLEGVGGGWGLGLEDVL